MIRLRPLNADDMNVMHIWRNSPDISRYMYSDAYISADEHERWFNSLVTDSTKKYWMIELNEERVGIANLADIDRTHRRCFWAFYLASPNVRGRGVGTFVEYFVLRYVFEELHFNKLCCEVLSYNDVVVQMHRQFGFKDEGLFRAHIYKQGEFYDVIRLGILRSEWIELAPVIRERLRAKNLI